MAAHAGPSCPRSVFLFQYRLSPTGLTTFGSGTRRRQRRNGRRRTGGQHGNQKGEAERMTGDEDKQARVAGTGDMPRATTSGMVFGGGGSTQRRQSLRRS
ncbi:hypothetical protein E2562_000638 [Oryza meyeriana var. granulata]|uniref:Uncharacterized protein n=1 Tax=Oryza meyeriana var. granulata TaxID=110450 RepID=A0A6G1DTQ1_9ORYZ|nr:hypothetical protein E2562_000638 [Oryza meyeriana var. granulata]